MFCISFGCDEFWSVSALRELRMKAPWFGIRRGRIGRRRLQSPFLMPLRNRAGRLRWWIATLLFASTTINYIDRQTLSVLAPYLKREFTWSNSDFALLVIAFRAAYAIFQPV